MLRNRAFRSLVAGQFLSLTGDGMYFAVLTFLVLSVEETGRALKAGIVGFMETVPFLVLSPVAGALVDRFSRRSVMLWSDALRGSALWVYVVLVRPQDAGVFNIAVLAFFLSAPGTVFVPARDALVPALFPESEMRARANAILQTLTQAAWLVGSATAAGVLTSLGRLFPEWTEPQKMFLLLGLDGASFWASFACLARMGNVANDPPSRERQAFVRDAVKGYMTVFQVPTVGVILALTAADNFFIMGPAQVGGNLLVKETLAGTAAMYGAFLSALFGGWIVGGLVLTVIGPKVNPLKGLILGIVMDGVTYLPFLWIREPVVAIIAIAVHGFFIPFITVMRTTYFQEVTPEEHRGKVFSLVGVTVMGFTAVSALVTGWAGEYIEPPVLFFIAGSGGAACGLLGWLFLGKWRHKTGG